MKSWAKNGVEIRLDDEQNGLYLLSYDGVGMPAFHRLIERGPLQHGITDVGYRLDERTIILVLGIYAGNEADFYDKRSELLNLFKPDTVEGVLKFEISTGEGTTVRAIKGHLASGLEFVGDDKLEYFQKTALVIKCPDPAWYDPEGVSVDFNISGGSDAMYVPMPVPMLVGASSIDAVYPVDYGGSVESFPVITIQGPITDCVITNNTTGDKLDFTGLTIGSSDIYTIDLRYGHKTVVDQSGASKLDKLTNDSDLATFCLVPDTVNSISVTGTGATSDTSINLAFFERFIGI